MRCTAWAYRVTAQAVAHLIFRCGGVRSVFLRGGSVRNCRPGTSDLDFLLVLEPMDTPMRVKTLLRVRKLYRLLRRGLGIPAEVIIDTAQNSADWISRWPLQRSAGMGDLLPLAGASVYFRPLGDEKVSLQSRALQAHQQYYHALLNFHASLREGGRRDFFLNRCQKYLVKARELAQGRQLARQVYSSKFSLAELISTAKSLNQIAALCFSLPAPDAPVTLLFLEGQEDGRSRSEQPPVDDSKRGSLPWPHVFTVDDTESLREFFENPQEWSLAITPLCVLPFSGMLLASGLHWGMPNSHLTPITQKRFDALGFNDHLRFHSFIAIQERAVHLAVLARGEFIWKDASQVHASLLQFAELVFLLGQRAWSSPEFAPIADDIHLRLRQMRGVESEIAQIAQCGEELLSRLQGQPAIRRDTASSGLITL